MHTPEEDERERQERRLSVQDDVSPLDGRDKASNCSFRFRVNNPSADTPNRTLLKKIISFTSKVMISVLCLNLLGY